MTTISFQVADEENALRLYAMLKAFGVENITKKEDVSPQELASIERGIAQAKKGMLTPSHLVREKAKMLCK
ncbi:MAG: hypothetical protein KGV44_11150 [Flavobacteriaceae bacterium]|nr:hypothetical protein [Flavobacteriaceae bacterium]